MAQNIIIESVDRLGKDTLIRGIMNQAGYFQVVHYQKPEKLDCYLSPGDRNCDQNALEKYQYESFKNMFKLLSGDVPLILNRAHLGECVYAPRYRGYEGNYVFELEREFLYNQVIKSEKFESNTLLVLLTTSSFDFIEDDGKSFDFTKKEEEQNDFIKAFNKSAMMNKIMIDVHDGNGGFRPKADILKEVLKASFWPQL